MSEAQEQRLRGLLDIKGLTRAFGGLMAVSDLDLSIQPGEFFGLIGPNGAGKTTVFNLISGVIPASSGKIHLGDADITGASPHTTTRLGLARTFQLTALFKSFTVLENVLLGTYGLVRVNPLASLFNSKKARATEMEQRERALHLLQFFGIERLGNELAGNLPLGHRPPRVCPGNRQDHSARTGCRASGQRDHSPGIPGYINLLKECLILDIGCWIKSFVRTPRDALAGIQIFLSGSLLSPGRRLDPGWSLPRRWRGRGDGLGILFTRLSILDKLKRSQNGCLKCYG